MIKSTGNVIEMNAQSTEVARSLRVLKPLIQEKLTQGREAAEKAGMPYYTKAGELLLEAKASPELKGQFEEWVKTNFSISPQHARKYMQLARATSSGRIAPSGAFANMDDFRRQHLGVSIPTGRVHREYQADVDKIAERARLAEARIKEEHLTREQEREAKRKLAERLIDIGYKVLAKELHPDKGGSKDAIQRLNEVRAELKGHRFN